MSDSVMEKKRIQSLDLVKVVAMLMVLMLHVNVLKQWSSTGFSKMCYALPGIAIPLFFMTSGYLMADKKVDRAYIIRKIWGIIRFSFIISVVVYGVRSAFHDDVAFPFPFCFLQLYDLGVFWYFGAMILVYAFLPLLQRVINSQRYFVPVLVGLVVFCNLAFIACHWGFEAPNPRQPIRLYYWFLYFLMGAYIRRNPACIDKIRLWWIVPAALLFLVFYYMGFVTTGIEHYFGALPCMVYAFVTFGALVRLPIYDSKVLGRLSATFLPVYAFHWLFLQECFSHTPFYTINYSLHCIPATVIDYLIVTVVMLAFGLIVMRIPYADRIFRI